MQIKPRSLAVLLFGLMLVAVSATIGALNLLPGQATAAGAPRCDPPVVHDCRKAKTPTQTATPANTRTATATPTPTNNNTPTFTPTPVRPDLTVQSMQITLQTGNSCAYPSTTLGVQITIANIGGAAAGPFVVDVNGAQQSVPALGAFSTVSLWISVSISGVATGTADVNNQVVESNESNNQLAQFLPVPTLPPTCTSTVTNTPTVTKTPTQTVTATSTPTP